MNSVYNLAALISRRLVITMRWLDLHHFKPRFYVIL